MSKVNDKSVGFVQGTAVLMADGKVKPIEKIRPGDWVMSFNTHAPNSSLEPKQVIDIFNYISRDILEVESGQDAVMVGRGQLFLTPGMDWQYAHETAYLTDAEGNERDFTVTKVNQGNFKIYDIIVDDNHSLVANGFRVHNGGSGNAGSGGPGGSGAAAGFANAAAQSNSQSTGRAHMSSSTYNSSNAGISGTYGNKVSSEPKGSFGFTDGDEGGFHSNGTNPDTRGNDNGGRGDRDSPGTRVVSNSVMRKETPPKPKPDEKALAYAAYSALQETMDYICDIQITYVGRSYFTVRTAVFEYMKYADALAADAINHINASNMGLADKNALVSYNGDIINTHDIIRRSWSSANDTAINLESIKRSCLNVKQFVDRSQAVIGKYIGQQSSNLEYTVPGLAKPGKVNLPTTVVAPEYVKTTADTWVTTAPSSVGTVTPPTTGGIGSSYTKTRVVRGYMYAYQPKKGWKKIGPADQKTNWL
mgnify:CR=1 FL=1